MEAYLQQLVDSDEASTLTSLNLDSKRMSPNQREFALLAQFDSLKSLSMANVGCTSLNGFPPLAHLQKLNLGDNKINALLPLAKAHLRKLRYLDLSNNQINDFATIQSLSVLSSLEHLYLFDCPISQLDGYHEMVMDSIENLKSLDNIDRDGVDIDAVEDFLDEEEVEGSEESEDEEEYTRPRVGGKGKGKGYGKGLGKGLGKGGKHASRGKTFAPKSISQSLDIEDDFESEEEEAEEEFSEEEYESEDGEFEEGDEEEDYEEEEDFEQAEVSDGDDPELEEEFNPNAQVSYTEDDYQNANLLIQEYGSGGKMASKRRALEVALEDDIHLSENGLGGPFVESSMEQSPEAMYRKRSHVSDEAEENDIDRAQIDFLELIHVIADPAEHETSTPLNHHKELGSNMLGLGRRRSFVQIAEDGSPTMAVVPFDVTVATRRKSFVAPDDTASTIKMPGEDFAMKKNILAPKTWEKKSLKEVSISLLSALRLSGSVRSNSNLLDAESNIDLKAIPKLITLMGKPQVKDQEVGADKAMNLPFSTTTYTIKSNEVRKIRIALESNDKVIEGMLQLLTILFSLEKNIVYLLDNGIFSKFFNLIKHPETSIRAKAAYLLCLAAQYSHVAFKIGGLPNASEHLLKAMKLIVPSPALCDVYEVIWQISYIKESKIFISDITIQLLPNMLSHLNECIQHLGSSENDINRLEIDEDLLYYWMTSIMGLLKHIVIHDEINKHKILNLGFLPLCLKLMDEKYRRVTPFFCETIYAISMMLSSTNEESQKVLQVLIQKTAKLLELEVETLSELEVGSKEFDDLEQRLMALFNLMKRILSKFERKALEVMVKYHPTLMGTILRVLDYCTEKIDLAESLVTQDRVVQDPDYQLLVSGTSLMYDVVQYINKLLDTKADAAKVILDEARAKLNMSINANTSLHPEEDLVFNTPGPSNDSKKDLLTLVESPVNNSAIEDEVLKEHVLGYLHLIKNQMSTFKQLLQVKFPKNVIHNAILFLQVLYSMHVFDYRIIMHELDIIPDVAFVILDLIHAWKEDSFDRGTELKSLSVPKSHQIGSNSKLNLMQKISLVQLNKSAESLTSTNKGKATAEIHFLNEEPQKMDDMDVILDAVGFLYHLSENAISREMIIEYALPAVVQLIKRLCSYDAKVERHGVKCHVMMIRLLHSMTFLDATFALALTAPIAVEIITCLTLNHNLAQVYAVEMIIKILHDITVLSNVEDQAGLKYFLFELSSRDVAICLQNLIMTNKELKQDAMVAYHEVLRYVNLFDKRRVFNPWTTLNKEWKQLHKTKEPKKKGSKKKKKSKKVK